MRELGKCKYKIMRCISEQSAGFYHVRVIVSEAQRFEQATQPVNLFFGVRFRVHNRVFTSTVYFHVFQRQVETCGWDLGR